MKINRTKILKYIESQYPFIDDTEKLALAESMINYFRNNIKKSHEKLKKFDRLMRMQDEEDDGLNLASEGINSPEAAARIKAALDSGDYNVIGGVYDVSDRHRPNYPPDANAILAPWYADYLKQKTKKRPIVINSSEGYYDKIAPDRRYGIKPEIRMGLRSPSQKNLLIAYLKRELEKGTVNMLPRDMWLTDKNETPNLSEAVNPKYSKLLRFLLSSNDPKIRNYAKNIYTMTMRTPERNRRSVNAEFARRGITDLADFFTNPQKYGIERERVNLRDSSNNNELSEGPKLDALKQKIIDANSGKVRDLPFRIKLMSLGQKAANAANKRRFSSNDEDNSAALKSRINDYSTKMKNTKFGSFDDMLDTTFRSSNDALHGFMDDMKSIQAKKDERAERAKERIRKRLRRLGADDSLII